MVHGCNKTSNLKKNFEVLTQHQNIPDIASLAYGPETVIAIRPLPNPHNCRKQNKVPWVNFPFGTKAQNKHNPRGTPVPLLNRFLHLIRSISFNQEHTIVFALNNTFITRTQLKITDSHCNHQMATSHKRVKFGSGDSSWNLFCFPSRQFINKHHISQKSNRSNTQINYFLDSFWTDKDDTCHQKDKLKMRKTFVKNT